MTGKFMKKNKQNNQFGFTLIEILVAMAIFTTATVTIADIFLLSNKSQRKTESMQSSESDARFAMEVMAQAIRHGRIDYNAYGIVSGFPGMVNPGSQPSLYLLDDDGIGIRFQRILVGGRGVLRVSQDSGATWTDITPIDISVGAIAFNIWPLKDPFIYPDFSSNQPLVTISMSTTNLSTEGSSLPPTFLQTTVSSRKYLR